MKVGINGAGRIGKMVIRIALERGIEIGCINDPFIDAKYLAYLILRDSTHGTLKDITIEHTDSSLIVRKEGASDMTIQVTNKKDPSEIEWDTYGIEYVVDSSGVFKTVEACQKHLRPGVKSVIITAPSPDAPMFAMGINEKEYNGETVVSNASCTTNCLAPVVKVIEEAFGIEEGLMSTVHALTATQRIVDGMSMKEYRDGRGALQNIIPASTGAASAIGKIIPALKGKLTGMSFRVPVANVSVVDLTARLKTSATPEQIKQALKNASETTLKGILGYTEEAVVSSDFIGSSLSSTFDADASIFLSDRFVKLVAWYDNECGYSHRVVDLLVHISKFHK
ncbi:glyceraldehyde 3-phosphate dehydrogenase (phosphorylating) [Nematocida parisii]|uniref:Glyceraldehyde-3-phosphate dehydrogenase n=1 Tax=Nematocida parisii (strain ERTm3) TaxID=935791 RepID=I3EDG6_NEMP3|nr:glyceraldehyde-3-phosphate dehydrogenase [Nematocida parisii ERTm1]EIJ87263.1 glyceraldehyde-3-phosphate dehydrogenase [Nematocida parisii ERTm3]KAI5126644.1 glyceraldehyde 3-phosphate dehydrogenase (phosphorylating) [Nematocida parisii]EIJ95038.1 glyceraldehyde-3-phosphate dehydrogenase [Nematocida parisii ERTm1]KAI5127927.1 glyceraldehyde 3-phosphate dehydrogenase (phosphorylating) [Nematocida parisii]KAI5142865.1 glyceraldehyde 3-phosphate dehydrogenase (phosphorylating) [Nematocida pari|eukprot:XP_013058394.1 glyceraldehyde-3-phosphate dehydrogenase [Nematocida parisii ERTm1]